MKDLTSGNVSKNLLRFAIPTIIASIVARSYSIVDQMMLGKIVGEGGLAASAATAGFIGTISSIFWGISLGITLHIAFLISSGDKTKTSRAIKSNMVVIVALAALLALAAILLWRPIFRILSVPEDIFEEARKYYTIYFSAFFCYQFNTCMRATYIAFGNSSFPMRLSLMTGAGNVLFNYLFIAVFELGVSGAAYATALMSAIASCCYILGMRREFRKIGIAKERFHFEPRQVARVWKMGVPCIIQQFIMTGAGALISPQINALGSASIAAYSIFDQSFAITAMMFQSSSAGLSSFAAQCCGKGEVRKIRTGFFVSLRQSLLFALPVMLLLLIFPQILPLLFLRGDSQETASVVINCVYICVPFMTFSLLNNLLHNFYRGVMMPKVNSITSFFYSAAIVISAYTMIPHFGIYGVFYSYNVAWVTEFIACLSIYLSGKWKGKAYKEAEQKAQLKEATV